jgi:regulatory protein
VSGQRSSTTRRSPSARSPALRTAVSEEGRPRPAEAPDIDAEPARPSESGGRASRSRPALSLKGRALGYLSRRDYSRTELAAKLARHAAEDEAIEPILDALEREGWLSDARFAESLVHRRAARFGASRIVSELKRHALRDTLIEDVSAGLRESEWDRAKAVWQKRYRGHVAQTPAERAKQARFLAARGFSQAIIVKLIKGVDDDFGDA